ncbi:GumC family protein [Megamonas hypermegale]|uniref:GumC family protein n=1 Tax=Megamonas hypermegale TaxID=158847 RepID=UPI0026EF74DE|nr:GumC family protein [Megamonas hypermegale]
MDINNTNNSEETIDLRKLLSVAGENKKILIAIIVICTVIAVIVAFVLPKSYQSTTLVRVKGVNTNVSGYTNIAASMGIDVGGSSATPENYMELMKSREVLEPIMAQIDMPEEDKEKLTTEDFIKKYLEITNAKNTDLINVAAYGKTPEEAQMISQSVADNFLTLMTDLNKEDNSTVLKFLNDRIAIAKEEMETAENKLAAYQQEKGIYSPSDQDKLLINQLNSYDTAIARTRADIEANNAKLANVNAQLSEQNAALADTNVAEDDAIRNIRTAIVNKRVELVGLQQRYTEEHPDVIRCRSELDELNQSLNNEISNALASQSVSLSPVQGDLLRNKVSTETAIAVNNASLDAITAKQAEVEQSLSTLSADSVEYVRLAREQNITTETYTNLVKAYENTRIKEAQDSMDIQVIDAANLPREDMPAKPNKKLIAAIGFVLGVMIAFGYTLYKYNRRYGL